MTKSFKMPEDLLADLKEAFDVTNAMRTVIAEANGSGIPISTEDSYHKEFVKWVAKYNALTDRIVPEVIPEYKGTGATWQVDFDKGELLVETD